MKANIPQGLTRKHQEEIEAILREMLINNNLEAHGAQQIVVCLNETKEVRPVPVFLGYLLGKDMNDVRIKRGEPDPGVARFGDRPTSFMYEECLSMQGQILKLDWTNLEDLEKMKPTEQAQSLKRGIKYQMMRAIKLNERWAGLLAIGFREKPNNRVFEKVLMEESQNGSLVDYLREKFEPGGPHVMSDTDMQLEETIDQVSAGISQSIKQGMNKLADILKVVCSRR